MQALVKLLKAADLIVLTVDGKQIALGHDFVVLIIRALELESPLQDTDVDQ